MPVLQSCLSLMALVALSTANPLLQQRATTCAADNCARAVYGTTSAVKPSLTSRLADCSSFFAFTVTPATSTSTTTVYSATTTVTVTSTTAAPARKRDTTGTPSVVPSYASACSGTARYSSACSCAGVKPTTITAPVPVTTTTVTAVSSTTTTVAPAATCNTQFQGTGNCRCQYTVTCGQRFSGSDIITSFTATSETQCFNTCDNYNNCQSADYSISTGACNVYRTLGDGPVAQADEDSLSFTTGNGSCGVVTPGDGCVDA